MKFIFTLILLIVIVPQVKATAFTSVIDDQQALEVTVYNSNVGLVKDTRLLNLEKGKGELRFMDVASGIMPQTVHVQSLNAITPISILEQNYEYDLMDEQKLLDKYVGKTIKLLKVNDYQGKSETVNAELLSNNNGQIYKIDGEIYLGHPGYKILPQIPENLIAKPTLTWLYDSAATTPQRVEVSYLTNGINWNADYVLVVNANDDQGNLSGWVTLDNQSGATYKNAKLKLVAGDVNRVMPQYGGMRKNMMRMEMADTMAASAPQFQEQSFFEYHLYDLMRPTTIKDNQKKQINLLEAQGIVLEKQYLISGEQGYFYANYGIGNDIKVPVKVNLTFKNSEANHMGMPLPAGTVRLYKEDKQKSLQFIGEDAIKHTPKDEELKIKVGEAFDVVAERQQMDFQQNNRSFETAWEIKIRNRKDSDISVVVDEPVQGDWSVLESSTTYNKANANTLRFKVNVPKGQEAVIKYRVRVKS